MVCRLRLCGLKWSGLPPGAVVKAPAFIAPESQPQLLQGSIEARAAMDHAKPRKWTEEETKLLSRSGRKECQRWRESLDVTSPPLDDELAN